MRAIYCKSAAIIVSILILKNLIPHIISHYIIRYGENVPPWMVGRSWVEYNILYVASSLLLFITYLLALYLLYRNQDLERIYKETIVVLIGILLLGSFLGRVIGLTLDIIYLNARFNPYIILSALTSSVNDIILYFFSGFTALSLSYLIHKKSIEASI